jgi:hypothetical protein
MSPHAVEEPPRPPEIELDVTAQLDHDGVDDDADEELAAPGPRRRWVVRGNRLVSLAETGATWERRDVAFLRRFQDRARWRLR